MECSKNPAFKELKLIWGEVIAYSLKVQKCSIGIYRMSSNLEMGVIQRLIKEALKDE